MTDEDGYLSNSTMTKAKNIIMQERIWINRVINETTFETHFEATGHLPPVRQYRNVDDCRVHRCGPHGTCVDGVNSHSCCCDPGFQETEVDRVKLDFIHTTNAQNVSYRLKVNEFASLTTRSDETEFASRYNGHKRNNVWSGQKHARDHEHGERRICISCGRWFRKNLTKRLRIPGTHCETGANRPIVRREQTVRRESFSGDSHGGAEEYQPAEQKDDAEARKELVYSVRFHLPSSHGTETSTLCARRRNIPYSTEIYLCHKVNSYRFGHCTRKKRIDDHWNVDKKRSLSGSWTGFTKFTLLKETPPKNICAPGRD